MLVKCALSSHGMKKKQFREPKNKDSQQIPFWQAEKYSSWPKKRFSEKYAPCTFWISQKKRDGILGGYTD